MRCGEAGPPAYRGDPDRAKRERDVGSTTVLVLAVVFVATLVRSSFGFGEALVAVPLLALRLPVAVAAPLAVLLSVLVAGVVVVQDWRDVRARSAAWLVGATLLGIPLGLWLLASADERVVKSALGVLILAFSAYSLRAGQPIRRSQSAEPGERRALLLGFGFAAGVLGGAYGMNGPPLLIYGAIRGWRAREFRATLQAYFLPASLAGLTGYWGAGLLTRDVLWYFLLSLPGAAAAILLGRAINHRLHLMDARGGTGAGAFARCVHAGLILIGAVLLVQAWRG